MRLKKNIYMEILYFLLLQLSTKQKEHPKSIHNAFL